MVPADGPVPHTDSLCEHNVVSAISTALGSDELHGTQLRVTSGTVIELVIPRLVKFP